MDLLDQDGRAEGISLSSADDALRLVLDATGTTITVHSDGKVRVAIVVEIPADDPLGTRRPVQTDCRRCAEGAIPF